MEITHNLGRPITDRELLEVLRAQNPDKTFEIGAGGAVVESFRQQPQYNKYRGPERSSRIDRVAVPVGNRATLL